jgi:putative hydroxymethylpyrimidine transporter CytX
MEEKKTSTAFSGLLWFGAAVSIAEILSGTLLAPLGFAKGVAAILLGHAIGCALLFLAGLIGGKTQKSAMETVKLSFGQKGSLLFSCLNVLQLVGWTAIMIYSGAAAANAVVSVGTGWVWAALIGLLILIWLLVGVKHLGKLNVIIMAALFGLTVLLSVVVFRPGGGAAFGGAISFGAAVELSVAMPLSWLPLISDYTRTAKKPRAAAGVGAVAYFFTSSWMYTIGMAAALFTGKSEIAEIMLQAGLGTAGLLIILLSTVTTTFLDSYSAGVSAQSISSKLKEKPVAILVCVVGTLLAIATPIAQFESFLYFIGSVFAPMVAIQIVDYFILKKDSSASKFNWGNLALWLVGFVLYRVFLYLDTPIGNTVPVMLVTGLLCFAANKLFRRP